MAVAILIADDVVPGPELRPEIVRRLAEIGVTGISLLRDGGGVGVVLEGWAFDPADIDEAAQVVFPAGIERVRRLREIGRLALTAAAAEGSAG